MKKTGKLGELLTPKPAAEMKRVNLYVTKDHHERFKAACAARGLSASEVIDAFMADFASEHPPSKKPRVR